jgi:hypothetical protein
MRDHAFEALALAALMMNPIAAGAGGDIASGAPHGGHPPVTLAAMFRPYMVAAGRQAPREPSPSSRR